MSYKCFNTIFVEPSNLKYYFHLRPESGARTKKSKKPGPRPTVAPSSSSSSGTKQGTNAEERGDGGSQADTGAAGEDKKNI